MSRDRNDLAKDRKDIREDEAHRWRERHDEDRD